MTATNEAGNVVTATHTINIVPAPLRNITLMGPSSGYANVTYSFTANVAPPTATLPVTYTWQVLDQGVVITTLTSLTSTLSFVWPVAGTKLITVTALNDAGLVVTATHSIVILPSSLTSIVLVGPATGSASTDYTFIASVTPPTASMPITYTWMATDYTAQVTPINALTASLIFNWTLVGVKYLTVTATNQAGVTVTDTHSIAVLPVPIASVTIGGPTAGVTDTLYSFTAVIAPVTTTPPIGYTWSPTPETGQGSATASYRWSTVGAQIIMVTATNVSASVVDTHTIFIEKEVVPPQSVSLTGPSVGLIQTSYLFTASIAPPTTTQPITYVWTVDDYSNVITSVSGVNASLALLWSTHSTKRITVTATNSTGLVVTSVHSIAIVPVPLDAINLSGPTVGVANTNYTFVTSVGPTTATVPVTYTWQVGDYGTIVTASNDLNVSLIFNWSVSGAKLITVTVTNKVGVVVTATQTVVITPAPLNSITLSGPSAGMAYAPQTFVATLAPPTATTPFTYTWSVAEQGTFITTTQSLSVSYVFIWTALGVKTITVTAVNPAGVGVTDTYSIVIQPVPVTKVSLQGLTAGVINTPYTFNATAEPVTATPPIVYTWEPAPDTGQGSATVNYQWSTVGRKVITVTAQNVLASATATHTIQIEKEIVPPQNVLITGASAGLVHLPYVFTATIAPITTTQPITYVWQTTGQTILVHVDEESDNATYIWNAPGIYVINVTAISEAGIASNQYTVTIRAPLSAVSIGAPVLNAYHTGYTFTAAVAPPTATTPITYVWAATQQTPVTHAGRGLNDTQAFVWNASGTKVVTVTAINTVNGVLGAYTVTIQIPPPVGALVAAPTGLVNVPQSFMASVSPLTATTPITYIWNATGQTTVSATTTALSHTVSFNWSTVGVKQITVTVVNAGGVDTRTQSITIQPRQVFLPLIRRPLDPPVLNTINDTNLIYTVSWNNVSGAQSYVVEEATNSAFISAITVYNGPGTAVNISGKPFGTYYYRVKACSASLGCSNWSNPQSIYVRWEYGDNNTVAGANGPLLSGQSYYGYPNDLWDCFDFQSHDGTVTVDLFNYTGSDFVLQLYYQSVDVRVASQPAGTHIRYTGAAGRYIVCIFANGGYNTITPYTLNVTFP